MMNPSELLTSLKMDLGIYSIALPMENVNEALFEVIKMRTIKTFSQYYPHTIERDVKLDEWQIVKSHYNESIYQIPDMFEDMRIIEVRKVNQKNKLIGGATFSPVFEPSIEMYTNAAQMKAGADLMSTIAPPFTFKYTQPNLLHLYNVATMSSELSIEFAFEHHDNLTTIPYTAWESFYELALLDVKRFLYNSMKHYNELQTAYGTIMLRIDDWANAESERKDLLSVWSDSYHMDSEQFYII